MLIYGYEVDIDKDNCLAIAIAFDVYQVDSYGSQRLSVRLVTVYVLDFFCFDPYQHYFCDFIPPERI